VIIFTSKGVSYSLFATKNNKINTGLYDFSDTFERVLLSI